MRHKSENSLFLDEKETNGPHTQYEKKTLSLVRKKGTEMYTVWRDSMDRASLQMMLPSL